MMKTIKKQMKIPELNENKNTIQQNLMRHIENSPRRELYSSKYLQWKLSKGTSKWLNYAAQKVGKNKQNLNQFTARNNKNPTIN